MNRFRPGGSSFHFYFKYWIRWRERVTRKINWITVFIRKTKWGLLIFFYWKRLKFYWKTVRGLLIFPFLLLTKPTTGESTREREVSQKSLKEKNNRCNKQILRFKFIDLLFQVPPFQMRKAYNSCCFGTINSSCCSNNNHHLHSNSNNNKCSNMLLKKDAQ